MSDNAKGVMEDGALAFAGGGGRTDTAVSLAERRVLEERARALATPVVAASDPTVEVITFHLNAEGYGIEARHVQEVMYLDSIVPLPGLKAPFVGITNCHGHILPVIDLLALLQAPQQTDAGNARHLVVLGQGSAELGIVASALGPVMQVAPGSIRAPAAASTAAHLVGMVPGLGILADGGSLLADPGLWINQK
ncbi:chemotaxis protein CheW [Marinobacterium rhizophilum]|uniref:Chemotaxis protein CheW n=1 Tax=Marinobacterium rhizophilum TaxID=420402 RepID=A0ABY5HEQ8_9GAMM|nr:chemotaxis protein CheW [Marinobacterium rhizophilum]UTW10068.1 chemotaxis protein CheW [Marinobacterium rhizophilum]